VAAKEGHLAARDLADVRRVRSENSLTEPPPFMFLYPDFEPFESIFFERLLSDLEVDRKSLSNFERTRSEPKIFR
jgi:hypothetical protein